MSWPFSTSFPHQNSVYIACFPHPNHMPSPSYPP
jgi:hypothetical protein